MTENDFYPEDVDIVTESESEDVPVSEVQEDVVIVMVENEPRPFLETPFSDYTVTEGLLLMLLLTLFVSCLVRIVREAFSWL